MKKLILLISFAVIVFQPFLLAQVAVNSDGSMPNPSALLDINAPDKGILIPRVTLNSIANNLSPVNDPAVGLLVYNQGGNMAPGFYFWSGQQWSNITTAETLQNVVNSFGSNDAFGEMHEYNPIGSYTNISIPASGTYVAWTTAAEGDLNNVTYSVSSLTVQNPGVYKTDFTAAVQIPSGGKIVDAALFVNNNIQNDMHARLWFKEGGKSGILSLTGLINLAVGDVVTVRFTMNDDGQIRIETGNLTLQQLN